MSEPFKRKPDLGGYVQVNERIRLFYERFPDGRLVTANVSVSTEPDGKPRVTVEALAYRAVDDPFPARGYSWMELPGSTNFTRGSELENTETSAWGRAIGALGIGIDKSIASQDEVRGKERDERPRTAAENLTGRPQEPDAPPAFDPAAAELSGLIGIAEIGKSDADFNIRQVSTPDRPQPFPRVAFRLTEGRRGIKVEAIDTFAELIHEYRAGIEGFRVTCWGRLRDETFTPKKTDGTLAKAITYQILTLSRLKVGRLDLSAPDESEAPDLVAAATELFPDAVMA